ncbi:Fe2+-dependent dioxygenase [Kordiimonas pumila]|uniref:Fe2+-dependent dioxygenase n=1 Tax=Kordiimonas pumila TaxID=2161677 RepID=A0ABV7D5D4_9PROT|nr:Fe2+-dependent dioxygenase [Kordiimonas pumila]
MLLCIGSILKEPQLALLKKKLAKQSFLDGKDTAGWAVKNIKRNEQLSKKATTYADIQQMLLAALLSHEVFTLAAMPQKVSPLLISRYSKGMGYGTHVDNALMGEGEKMRSDISFTLFLSDPADYEGGELVLEDFSGEQPYKLPAGSVILYPSTMLHRVETVTLGERLVAVGWIQSHIRSSEKRQIIFDLESVKRDIFQASGKTAQFDTIAKTASNLWRLWAET